MHHYDMWRAHGSPLADPVKKRIGNGKGPKRCVHDGCGAKVVAFGLCGKHYYRLKAHGDPGRCKIERTGRSRDWHVSKDGYVMRNDKSDPLANPITGIVYKHRAVMAEILGRPLNPNESVHHINGDRADNRPENLELWVKSQPAGQRVEDLVNWANEILERYENEVQKIRSFK